MNHQMYFSETARSESLEQVEFLSSVNMLGTLQSDPSQATHENRVHRNASGLRSSQTPMTEYPNSQQTNAGPIERPISQISGKQAMVLTDNLQLKSCDFVPNFRPHRNFVLKRVTTACKARQPDKNSRIQATYNVNLDNPTKVRCKSTVRRNNKSNTTQRYLQADMFLPEIQTHTIMTPSSAFQTVLSPVNKAEFASQFYTRNPKVFQNRDTDDFTFENKTPESFKGQLDNFSDFHNLKKVLIAAPPAQFRPLLSPHPSAMQTLVSNNLLSDTSSVSVQQRKTHVKVAGKNGKEQISIDQVSPELAAQIVKHFILPMFESDKHRPKYTRKTSGKSQTQTCSSSQKDQTIYGDLKLTEKLGESLAQLQFKFDNLSEQLEDKTFERDKAIKQVEILQKKNRCLQKAIWDLKQQLKLSLQQNEGLQIKSDETYNQIEGLTQIGILSEQLRQKFSEDLKKVMSTNEQLENVVINKGTTERLQKHAIEYLQDQFKILYKAIEHLAIDKREGDRLNFKINNLIEEANEKMEQYTGLQIHSKILMEERDRFVDDLKDLIDCKKTLSKELLIQRYTLKDKIGGLEIALKKKSVEFEAKVEENFKLDKQNKTLVYDRDKSKQRIQKLLQRKGKFDSGIKSCKKCNKEYNEKENFNWSCRTHQSEWGGELWWCCGKRGKEMPGCKYSKHESKDEENDSENEENEDHRTMKYTRCYCCKELGHNIEQCIRDPNLKTGAQMVFDWERIQRIKDFRKLYVDTVVQTTQYLKNAVKIPRTEDDEGDLVEPENTQHPFMRGVMNFDDYNYATFNKYILREEPNAEEKRRLRHEEKRLKLMGHDAASKISEANLEKIIHQKYEFEETSEAPVEKVSEKLSSIEESGVGSKKTITSQISSEETETVAKPQESAEEQSEMEDTLGEDEQDDDFLFKVYYRPEEINNTQRQQERDVFYDIMSLKTDAVSAAQQYGAHSKFNIEDYLPVKMTKEAAKVKKQSEKLLQDEQKSLQTEQREKQSDETSNKEQLTAKKLQKLDEKSVLEYYHNHEAAYLKVEIKEIIEETIRTSPTNSQTSLRSAGKGKKKGRAKSVRRNSKTLDKEGAKEDAKSQGSKSQGRSKKEREKNKK